MAEGGGYYGFDYRIDLDNDDYNDNELTRDCYVSETEPGLFSWAGRPRRTTVVNK